MTATTMDTRQAASTGWRRFLGLVAILFGIGTIIEGGHVLFGGPEARAAAGKFVPFVLVFNFGAGFVYVLTGILAVAKKALAAPLARALAVLTLLVFASFGVHVLGGGDFERRTVVAMTVRSVFWMVQAVALNRLLSPATGSR